MTLKLWVLNGVLITLGICAVVKFRTQQRAMRDREVAILTMKVTAAPQWAFRPLAMRPPVTATSYSEIALHTLFDPSRTPEVVVEVPPPPPAPVMPPLPVCYGVMNLGDEAGPGAFLSENEKSVHEYLHAGAIIGQFKLIAIDTDEITLEWNGQEIRRPVTLQATFVSPTEMPAQHSTRAMAAAVRGGDAGPESRRCSINDGYADGTESDGYRKKVYMTAFGPACVWEALK